MEKLLLMLQLQNELNEATSGSKWTTGVTDKKKEINWRRCIYMECAEIVDSFAWKHWKSIDKEPDYENIKIEIVDIWHFVMSLAIEQYEQNMLGGVDELAIAVSNMECFSSIDAPTKKFSSSKEIIEACEELIAMMVSQNSVDLDDLLELFFKLVLMCELNLDSLYRLYVGKNVLNQFRQDHGYKEGTYNKEWNGIEDNVVMKKVWEESGDIAPSNLYKELAKMYTALHKK